jgi:hypothetical protein
MEKGLLAGLWIPTPRSRAEPDKVSPLKEHTFLPQTPKRVLPDSETPS